MTTGLASGVANSILDSLARNVSWTPRQRSASSCTPGIQARPARERGRQHDPRGCDVFRASSGSITNSADVNWTNVAPPRPTRTSRSGRRPRPARSSAATTSPSRGRSRRRQLHDLRGALTLASHRSPPNDGFRLQELRLLDRGDSAVACQFGDVADRRGCGRGEVPCGTVQRDDLAVRVAADHHERRDRRGDDGQHRHVHDHARRRGIARRGPS
jgi:hypothetical protein